jgi:hypothetical protein
LFLLPIWQPKRQINDFTRRDEVDTLSDANRHFLYAFGHYIADAYLRDTSYGINDLIGLKVKIEADLNEFYRGWHLPDSPSKVEPVARRAYKARHRLS